MTRPLGTFINSQLSRLNIARGSGIGLVTVGPAKVACKSILFTEGIPGLVCGEL